MEVMANRWSDRWEESASVGRGPWDFFCGGKGRAGGVGVEKGRAKALLVGSEFHSNMCLW